MVTMTLRRRLKNYEPLIAILLFILLFVGYRMFARGSLDFTEAMLDFMAGFFIIFGTFKALKLPKFVEAYRMYDVVAAHSNIYAYIYPFIEVSLGLAFLFRFDIVPVAWITLCLMIINSIGAWHGARDPHIKMCACLGTVFKIPMSYVTLGEDVLMGAMAVMVLLAYM